MDFLGALISGASNLIGGLFNRSSAQAQNAANIQEQLNFAQNGLTWKAQDATRAQAATGINRLALLGVPTNSFSNLTGDTSSLGQGIANAGQDIGRAITAGNPQLQREHELNLALTQAKIDNVNADTVRQQAEASALVRKYASPGTAKAADPNDGKMYITVYGRQGEPIEIPNPKYATSLQTPASWPQQAAMAVKAPFEMAHDAYTYYKGIYDRQAPIGRPDVFRSIDPQSMQSMY